MATKKNTASGGLIVSGLLLLLLIGGEIFKRDPDQVERFYAHLVYPPVIQALNHLWGWVPFSVFEMLLTLLAGVLMGTVVFLGWRLFRGKTVGRVSISSALRLLSAILSFIILFNVLWGFNYYRLPLAEQLGISLREHTQSELKSLCTELIGEANALSVTVARDAGGAMVSPENTTELLSRTALGFQEAHGQFALFSGTFSPPKAVWQSEALSYAGISGIYSPFTGEANVNALIPVALLPATAMHETAHLYGYAREDEANFIAWLTCRLHPDADYRYSGALLALIYSMNALYSADPAAYQQLKVTYSAGVQADLKANRDFWKRYEGPAEKLQDRVNDRYLKANGQTDGVASYGRMVDLLLEVKGGKLSIGKEL